VRYHYHDSLQVYSGISGSGRSSASGRSSGSSLIDKTALILIVTTLIFDFIKNLSRTNSIQDKRKHFLPARRDSIAQSLLRQRVWLGGWVTGRVSVTRRYCIKKRLNLSEKFSNI